MEKLQKTSPNNEMGIGYCVSTVRKSANDIIDYIDFLEDRIEKLECLVSILCEHSDIQ